MPPPSVDLKSIARRAMLEHGLEPDLPPAAAAQLNAIAGPPAAQGTQIRDLRGLLWCSIDNDDSRDLDQLSVAVPLAGGAVRILVAIADVDATIAAGSPLDAHAAVNTTSVYTAAQIFPMFPERLSTDLTSLAPSAERLSVVIDMTIAPDGSISGSDIYRAAVVNRAKLAYNSVAAWLDGCASPPPGVAAVAGMDQQLRIQDGVAQILKRVRRAQGSLTLTTLEAQAIYQGGALVDLKPDENNRGKELIEYFMIAANGVVARFLESHGRSSLRRALPAPAQFPDLSLAVVKLLGAGEYVLKRPGLPAEGHFGLAVADYTHATAPNRRFPDVITQRLLKAALGGGGAPYGDEQLRELGLHCTEQERNAAKVERQVGKSAAALLLQPHIGERFEALVTGASDKGTWVRVSQPLAEGRVVKGFEGLDVGDTVRVQLVHTDVQRGFIDFACVR